MSATIWRPRLVTANCQHATCHCTQANTKIDKLTYTSSDAFLREKKIFSVLESALELRHILQESSNAAVSLPADTRQCATFRLCLARSKTSETCSELSPDKLQRPPSCGRCESSFFLLLFQSSVFVSVRSPRRLSPPFFVLRSPSFHLPSLPLYYL